MKVIGAEEHITFPELMDRIPKEGAAAHAMEVFQGISSYHPFAYADGRVDNAGAQRIKDMDEGGISVQILSFTGPINTTFMEPQAGLEVAQAINNELKKAADSHGGRLFPLAELPFQDPQLAIQELRRCVQELGFVGAMLAGSVGGTGLCLDDPRFDPLLACFEELDVPLYLHPNIVPKAVYDTLYTIPGKAGLSSLLAGPGWGWHSEAATHTLRLAISGTLDRHPRLKVILGHAGEMMPALMHRFDVMFDREEFGLQRTVGEMLRSQVWLSISGVFCAPPTMIAIQAWGVDRILFGNDYPYVDAQSVPMFLKGLGDVVAPSDLRKICQTNAEKLFKIKA